LLTYTVKWQNTYACDEFVRRSCLVRQSAPWINQQTPYIITIQPHN